MFSTKAKVLLAGYIVLNAELCCTLVEECGTCE